MIIARKRRWFERVFAVYNRNLIARKFEGLRVAGLDDLREGARDAPLMLYANHSSWWDGLVIFQVARACALDLYAMMEEKQLRRYPFHHKIGAFSVVRENAREAMRSIEYAADLIRDTGRTLLIFPQGETMPNDARPFKLYSGAARIISRTGRAFAAPVAIRYEFLEDFRPEIFVRIGALEKFEGVSRTEVKRLTASFAENLTRTLEQVRADVLGGDLEAYVELVAPSRRRRANSLRLWRVKEK